MARNQPTSNEYPNVDETHDVDGVSFVVKTKSRFSRHIHKPKVDRDGNVVFDDNYPVTKCGIERGNDEIPRKLVPVSTINGRDPCSRCFADDETISERNKTGAGKRSWARRQRYGDDWGNGA